jgi:PleD family two-component response regulator
MEQTEFSGHRVLLIGAKTHNVQVLRSVLAMVGVGKVVQVGDSNAAINLLSIEHFHAVFCELEAEAQLRFALAARRRDAMLNPMIPIFLLQGQMRRRHVEEARDTGATDLLTTPLSPRTVASKLRAAAKNPRPFIVAQEFFGPDRRSKVRPAYAGNDRRKKAPKKTRVDFIHI